MAHPMSFCGPETADATRGAPPLYVTWVNEGWSLSLYVQTVPSPKRTIAENPPPITSCATHAHVVPGHTAFPEQLAVSYGAGTMHLGGDSFTDGVDIDKECYPAGQGVGAITELVPAGELVRRFVAEAEAVLDRLPSLR